jgi:hypothetical protein
MIDEQKMLDFQMALFEVQEAALNLPEVDWQTSYDNGRALLDDVEHLIRKLVSQKEITINSPPGQMPAKGRTEALNNVVRELYSPTESGRESAQSLQFVKMDEDVTPTQMDKDPILVAASEDSGESTPPGKVQGTEQVTPGGRSSLMTPTINEISLQIATVVFERREGASDTGSGKSSEPASQRSSPASEQVATTERRQGTPVKANFEKTTEKGVKVDKKVSKRAS